MSPTAPRDPSPSPPPDDRAWTWGPRWPSARIGATLRIALIALAVLAVSILWATIGFRDTGDQGVVLERYNDALVADDLDAAWGLICPSDREDSSLEEFREAFRAVVAPLGGLESWSRLRGGPEWHGPNGSEQRNPEIIEEGGQHCVRSTSNPLGEPF